MRSRQSDSTGSQRLPVSSHLKNSSPSRSAKRDSAPSIKEQSLKSTEQNERVSWSAKLTRSDSSSGSVTAPMNTFGGSPFVSTVTLSKVLDFFHIQNLSNASFEEAIFLHILYSSLATQAKTLAAIFPGSLRRPLQALLEAMNEPGKNCTKQSAKRKPPSNSPTSSRKHS